jgi:hypothetical protein
MTALSLASCSSPDAALGSMQSDVKSSLNMYLVIKAVTPAKDATEINSNSPIYIDVDRSLSSTSIGAAAISVKATTDGATAVDCAYSYDDAQKRITITPSMLEGKTTYLVTVNKKLMSAASEELRDEYLWSFTTSASPSGTMKINSGATYSNDRNVTLNITANSYTGSYRYSETTFAATDTNLPFDALPAGNPKTASTHLSSAGDGTKVLYYQYIARSSDLTTAVMSCSIILDTTAPNAPTVSGDATTTSSTPTWTWAAAGGGNGTFRYQLDSTTGAWTETTGTSYTATSALAEGNRILYVEERDDAGNWSSPGSYTTNIETLTVSAGSNRTWLASYSTYGIQGSIYDVSGLSSYRWDVVSGPGTLTYTPSGLQSGGGATSLSPVMLLTAATVDGTYSIRLTATCASGTTKTSTISLVVDLHAPVSPTVTLSSPSTPTTTRRGFTWTWTSGGGGNGTYQCYFAPAGGYFTVTGTSYSYNSSQTQLADGTYTFWAQEYDSSGNVSGWGNNSIVVNGIPATPTVSLTTRYLSYVTDNTPTWTWSSNGFGNGTFRYLLYDSTTGTTVVDWTSTTATSYTAPTLTNVNGYYLYVQEYDGVDWSYSGYKYCYVTQLYPYDTLTGVSTATPFFWRGSTAINIVNTVQKYTAHGFGKLLYYSWDAMTGTYSGTYFMPSSTLSASTSYTWRIMVENTLLGTTGYIPSEAGVTFTTQ